MGEEGGAHYNGRVLALRYLHALALAVWLGGMLVLGFLAAPAIFEVVERATPGGRGLAGAVFGTILRRFHVVAALSGATVVASLLGRVAGGAAPPQWRGQLLVAAAMLGLTLYAGLLLTPRIERLQQAAGGLASSLEPTDPRRVAFTRLHQLSTTLMLVNIAGGLVLLYWQVRE